MFVDFLERGEGRKREREGERNINWLLPTCALAGDRTGNPGMCPDWEPNPGPFGFQDDAQPTGLHQPGCLSAFQMKETQPSSHTPGSAGHGLSALCWGPWGSGCWNTCPGL